MMNWAEYLAFRSTATMDVRWVESLEMHLAGKKESTRAHYWAVRWVYNSVSQKD